MQLCVFPNYSGVWVLPRVVQISASLAASIKLFCKEGKSWRQVSFLQIPQLRRQYLLRPRSSQFEKLTGSQLVKKFPAFYGTRRFFTTFTISRHLSLSWASSIQYVSHSNPIPGDPSEYYPPIYTWVFRGPPAMHRARILVAARVIWWE